MIAILSYVFLAVYLAGVLCTLAMFFYLVFSNSKGRIKMTTTQRRLVKSIRRAA